MSGIFQTGDHKTIRVVKFFTVSNVSGKMYSTIDMQKNVQKWKSISAFLSYLIRLNQFACNRFDYSIIDAQYIHLLYRIINYRLLNPHGKNNVSTGRDCCLFQIG